MAVFFLWRCCNILDQRPSKKSEAKNKRKTKREAELAGQLLCCHCALSPEIRHQLNLRGRHSAALSLLRDRQSESKPLGTPSSLIYLNDI